MNHALVIGISRYAHQSNLGGVANDVREISRLLASSDQTSYSLTTLLDADATKEQIEKNVSRLVETVGADDTVILFLAGHGDVSGDVAYFLPAEFSSDHASNAVSLRWLREQFDRLPSRKALLLLDFCHSGGAISRSGMTAISRALDLEGEGKVIISACSKTEKSHEDSTSGHGWFTKAVLDGLKGGAKNTDGWVTVNSLFQYVCQYVKTQVNQFFVNQTPQMHGTHNGEIRLVHTTESPEVRLATKALPGPKLKRAGYDQDVAARELFDSLHELLMDQQETLQEAGVRFLVQKNEHTEKIYSLKLQNGKQLSLAIAMGGLLGGFGSVKMRYGWNASAFALSGSNSANDIFTPENKPGQPEDWVRCSMGAVVKAKESIPKTDFLNSFWDFVCRQLEMLDR